MTIKPFLFKPDAGSAPGPLYGWAAVSMDVDDHTTADQRHLLFYDSEGSSKLCATHGDPCWVVNEEWTSATYFVDCEAQLTWNAPDPDSLFTLRDPITSAGPYDGNSGVKVDGSGNLYFVGVDDTSSQSATVRIRRIDTAGNETSTTITASTITTASPTAATGSRNSLNFISQFYFERFIVPRESGIVLAAVGSWPSAGRYVLVFIDDDLTVSHTQTIDTSPPSIASLPLVLHKGHGNDILFSHGSSTYAFADTGSNAAITAAHTVGATLSSHSWLYAATNGTYLHPRSTATLAPKLYDSDLTDITPAWMTGRLGAIMNRDGDRFLTMEYLISSAYRTYEIVDGSGTVLFSRTFETIADSEPPFKVPLRAVKDSSRPSQPVNTWFKQTLDGHFACVHHNNDLVSGGAVVKQPCDSIFMVHPIAVGMSSTDADTWQRFFPRGENGALAYSGWT